MLFNVVKMFLFSSATRSQFRLQTALLALFFSGQAAWEKALKGKT
jgi:hypothetical protein